MAATGAPTDGFHIEGERVLDRATGEELICTKAGHPGTWVSTRLGLALEGDTDASGASTGMEIGIPTRVSPTTVEIAYASVWGIDGNNLPYYDPDGAADGEAARLDLDADGLFFLIRPQGAVTA